jgi:hypothetical protein
MAINLVIPTTGGIWQLLLITLSRWAKVERPDPSLTAQDDEKIECRESGWRRGGLCLPKLLGAHPYRTLCRGRIPYGTLRSRTPQGDATQSGDRHDRTTGTIKGFYALLRDPRPRFTDPPPPRKSAGEGCAVLPSRDGKCVAPTLILTWQGCQQSNSHTHPFHGKISPSSLSRDT